MRSKRKGPGEIDLPAELASPARRALIAAGYTRLEQLVELNEAEVGQLHGNGPNAHRQLRRALPRRQTAPAARRAGPEGGIAVELRQLLVKRLGALPVVREYLERLQVRERVDALVPVREVAHLTNGQVV